MTIPTSNENYSIATGTSNTNVFIPILQTRDPTTADTTYPIYKRWINSSDGSEFILKNFTQSSGIITANWLELTANFEDLIIDGDTGSASPSSDILNLITGHSTINSGSSVLFSASGSTVTLNVTDSNQNTILGNGSGNLTLSGNSNCGYGYQVLQSLTSGIQNFSGGYDGMQLATSATANCGVGTNNLNKLLTGIYNLAAGTGAGSNYTTNESSNILFNNPGTITESNTLRIGAANGTGNQELSKVFICGINGNTASSPRLVTIDTSTNQLAVMTVPSIPSFPLSVANGGTGDSSFTAYAPICGGTTTTGNLQQATTGFSTSGYVLTSTGASSLPSFQANSTFSSVVIQVIDTTGTYTPTSGMKWCSVVCIGGGGGGGGCDTPASFAGSCGGGGGAGGYTSNVYSAATIGASQSVTIGAQGSAGSAGNNAGGSGGTSTFGALLTSGGGSGGGSSATAAGSAATGGTGGSVSGGLVNIVGAPGCPGIGPGTTSCAIGGNGASAYFGGGGNGAAAYQSSAAGGAATGYGGGGGGAAGATSGTSQAGGRGNSGVVIITQYIA